MYIYSGTDSVHVHILGYRLKYTYMYMYSGTDSVHILYMYVHVHVHDKLSTLIISHTHRQFRYTTHSM